MDQNDESGRKTSRLRQTVAVVAVFVALTAVLTFPLSLEPGTRALPLSADTRLFLWTLSWDVHALLHQPLRLFDANIFHPEPRTLAYSEHLVGSAVLGAPFLLATDNPVLALNVVVLLSCVLSGAGTFLLARQLGIGAAGAFAAGVIFAFAPPRFTRLAQLHLATVQWIPFCLAFVHAYLQRGRRRDLLLAIGFFTLQSVTSGHGGLFLFLSLMALAVYLVVCRRLPPVRTFVRDVGVAGILLLAINLPFLVPYFRVQRELGLRRTIGAVYDWVPNAASFLASPTHVDQALLSLAPSLALAVADARAYMFPGWLTLLLVGALFLPSTAEAGAAEQVHAAWPIRGRRRWAGPAPGCGFYAVLALPFDLGQPGPALRPLHRALQFVAGLRPHPCSLTPGDPHAAGHRDPRGSGSEPPLERASRGRPIAASVLVLLLAAEFAQFPLNAPAYAIEVGELDRWLASRPRPFVAAELPVAAPTDAIGSARYHSHYMLHSMLHWQPIVNGYSGFVPPRHEMLFDQLTRFPDEGSVRALEKLGVNYVLLHRGDYGEERFAKAVADAQALFPTRLALEHESSDGRVYSVRFAQPKGRW